MKSSGQAAVQFSSPIESGLRALLNMTFPAAQAAGLISALPGLSGTSWRLELADGPAVLRTSDNAISHQALRRHYRALTRKAPGCGPQPLRLGQGWMVHGWLPGEVTPEVTPAALAALLARVHAGRRFGWRITLLPLLERAWQQADPRRHRVRWLRALRRLRQQVEPVPLRLAPLHMDVHPGNLVKGPDGLRLLDWEYAGDGDIALELATLALPDDQMERLVADYAARARLAPAELRAAIVRWRPWVQVLIASWYECRWQQTGEAQFIQLADAAWRPLI